MDFDFMFFVLGKLFSDSTFYETKDGMYPTIPEQMRLCKMISGILQAPDAMRSRGGKMFHKRKQKAGEWTSEAMGKRLERAYEDGISRGEAVHKLVNAGKYK